MISKEEFNAALALLGWNGKEACKRLCIHYNTLAAYKSGKLVLNPKVERILRLELRNKENFKDRRMPYESINQVFGG